MGALPRSGTRPTARELAALEFVTRPGACDRAAADALGISVSALHGRLRSLNARLGVRSRAQALHRLRETDVVAGAFSRPTENL